MVALTIFAIFDFFLFQEPSHHGGICSILS